MRRRKSTKFSPRHAFALGLTLAVLMSLGFVGGLGYASSGFRHVVHAMAQLAHVSKSSDTQPPATSSAAGNQYGAGGSVVPPAAQKVLQALITSQNKAITVLLERAKGRDCDLACRAFVNSAVRAIRLQQAAELALLGGVDKSLLSAGTDPVKVAALRANINGLLGAILQRFNRITAQTMKLQQTQLAACEKTPHCNVSVLLRRDATRLKTLAAAQTASLRSAIASLGKNTASKA
jgi:hypothetical protein